MPDIPDIQNAEPIPTEDAAPDAGPLESPQVHEPPQPAEIEKEPAPMIDIHDAHHAASSWRDFFIHIATIVLGLIIAVSLEQAVEAIHHHSERRQLEEDLRAEAERRIPLITEDLKQFAADKDWEREGLQRGRAATASGGFVTFVLPDRPQTQSAPRPEGATWPAAKASGLVAVLPNQEIEGWDRVDIDAQLAMQGNDDVVKASEDLRAVADRLGVSVAPGATVRVTPEERDELMRALALHYEKERHFMTVVANWQGASDAAAAGPKMLLAPELGEELRGHGACRRPVGFSLKSPQFVGLVRKELDYSVGLKVQAHQTARQESVKWHQAQ